MRQTDADGARTPNQALWERLLRRACSATGPQERLACLMMPLAEAPALRGALVDAARPLEVQAVHPAGCAIPLPESLPAPTDPSGCWWMAEITQGTLTPSVAVIRRCPDGHCRAVILCADLPAQELKVRVGALAPALATALSLPPGEPVVDPTMGVDPLEMAQHVSAALAHDVRNIMSGIIGALELHRSAGQGAGEEVFDSVRRRAVEGVAMVEAMMERLRGRPRPPTEPLDLAAAVSGFAADIHPLVQVMSAEGVAFQSSGQWAQARLGRSELYRALLALVFNSWRACRNRGTVEVGVEMRRGRAVVEVRDDGAGMTPQVHLRAKEPFYTTEPELHWGLGLTIAEEVAKQAQGSLVIRPREDRGTTVTLSLPLVATHRGTDA